MGSKKWPQMSQFIKLPNLSNRQDGLRGWTGFGQMRIKSPARWGMWAVLSALSIAAMLSVALAPVEKMRGFAVKGGSDTAARAVSLSSLRYQRIR